MADQETVLTKHNYTDREFITSRAAAGHNSSKPKPDKTFRTGLCNELSKVIETADDPDIGAVACGNRIRPSAVQALLDAVPERLHNLRRPYARRDGSIAELPDILLPMRVRDASRKKKGAWIRDAAVKISSDAVFYTICPETAFEMIKVPEARGLSLDQRFKYEPQQSKHPNSFAVSNRKSY